VSHHHEPESALSTSGKASTEGESQNSHLIKADIPSIRV
jgi:hypothetical protein